MSKYFEKFLERAKKIEFNWSQLNQIKDVKIISSMYVWIFIVPILAKVLSLVSDIATVTVFNYTFEVNIGLPFSWRSFYFSALFFLWQQLFIRLAALN